MKAKAGNSGVILSLLLILPLLFILSLLFISCNTNHKNADVFSIPLKHIGDQNGHFKSQILNPESQIPNPNSQLFASFHLPLQTSVIIFLSPSCPMCQNYSLVLNQLNDHYKEKGIAFYGIFSGQERDTLEQKTFAKTYKINFDLLLDEKKQLANNLHATITPEVFLIDTNKEIIYKGSIDNWLIEPGKKRSIVTEHYLEDALWAVTSGNKIKISSTEAKGCLIE